MKKYGELRNIWDFLCGASGKDLPANTGDTRDMFDPWVGKIHLEEGMATQSSILAWRIPWTEELGKLQFSP